MLGPSLFTVFSPHLIWTVSLPATLNTNLPAMAYQDPYNNSSPYSTPQRPHSSHPQYSDDNLSKNYDTNNITPDYQSDKGILRQSSYSLSNTNAQPLHHNHHPNITNAGGARQSRIPRFQGAELNADKERPSSQWTQGIEPPPKSTGILRMWRKENRAGWVRVSE